MGLRALWAGSHAQRLTRWRVAGRRHGESLGSGWGAGCNGLLDRG